MAPARETASTLSVRPLAGGVTPIPPGDELRPSGWVGGLVLHIGGGAAVAEQVGALIDDLAAVEYAHRACLADALGVLHTRDDLACVLLGLADVSSLATLEALLGGRPDAPPVIVLVSGEQHDLAQRARRSGADDVVFEGELGGSQLARAITYAIERRSARRERIERESFIRTVLDSLAAHTAVIDRDGIVTEVNASWREFSVTNGGEERSCGVGVDYLAVCDTAATDGVSGAAEVAAGIRAVLDGRVPSYQQDYECPSPDERRWFAMEVDPLPGTQGGALVFHVPVTRLKKQAAALERLAFRDELTGLPNRASFSQALDRALRGDRASGLIAVLICDLDDFKVVNDSLGHAAGDEVLIEVGRRLRQNTRSGDTIARVGGDEFAIMLQATSDEEIDRAARRLSDSLREPVTLSTREQVRHGSSIGIAVASAEVDASSLLRDADAAMYRAKELGRRRIHRFDHQVREEALQRLALQHDLLGALQRGELFCHYQPAVELATGQLFGFESLARWVHPTRGPLSPARFVPIIERVGEATTLFDHVLSQTLTAAQLWYERSGAWLTMAINLSAHQLGDPSLLGSVAHGLQRAGIEPSRLWLEVTETAVADATSLRSFERLHDLGVRLAIDDFGTGYSSMARIAGFGWDACKIDRSFVEKLGNGARSIHVVEAIIAMAHSLDMLVIAEGVETAEQQARLAELGCDIAQGYRIAPPAPLESFRDEISTSGRWRNWDRLRA